MKSILERNTKEALREYLSLCSKHVDIDIDKAYELAVSAIKYYNGDKSVRQKLRVFQELERKWYQSLTNESPDYSVYDDKYILSELWACWVVYSRKYLLSIRKNIMSDFGKIDNIVDLGCGFGYTTAALKELFPKANVFGTNFENSCQYRIANEIGKQFNFSLISSAHALNKKTNLVFASEYFEHIENPVEHLIDIIHACAPKYFIIANAFNAVSLGHFNEYRHQNDYYFGKQISRLFNSALRAHHYVQVKTKCWNNRPTYWKKIS